MDQNSEQQLKNTQKRDSLQYLKKINSLNDQIVPHFNDELKVDLIFTTDSQLQENNNNSFNHLDSIFLNNNDQINIGIKEQIIPKIYCTYHKDKLVELISISKESKQKLYCYECVFLFNKQQQKQQQNQQQMFMEIQDIFSDSDDPLFNYKFLQLEDPQYNEFYNSIQDNCLEDNVFNYFEDSLQHLKKIVEQQIENDIQKYYLSKIKFEAEKNQRLKKQENCDAQQLLKNCIANNYDFPQKLEKELNNLQKINDAMEQQISGNIRNQEIELINSINLIYNFPNYFPYELMFIKNANQLFGKNLENFKNILDFKMLDLAKLSIEGLQSVEVIQDQIQIKNEKVDNNQYELLNLNFDEKYEVLIEYYNQRADDALYIGFCSQTQYFQSHLKQQIPCFNSSYSADNIRVDKGILITKRQMFPLKLKIQLCIKDSVFRWKFGENINSIKSWNHYSSKDLHYLYIDFYHKNQKVLVQQFKRVLIFEQW